MLGQCKFSEKDEGTTRKKERHTETLKLRKNGEKRILSSMFGRTTHASSVPIPGPLLFGETNCGPFSIGILQNSQLKRAKLRSNNSIKPTS